MIEWVLSERVNLNTKDTKDSKEGNFGFTILNRVLKPQMNTFQSCIPEAIWGMRLSQQPLTNSCNRKS